MTIKTRKRLTSQQKKAIDAYLFACAQEERYMGSVFVTPRGQRDHENKVSAAYAEVVRLGVKDRVA